MTHSITKPGWVGFNQMMDTLFTSERWMNNARFELRELARLRIWWPEVKGREIPRSVVLYRLNRLANCRRLALQGYFANKAEG